MAADALSRRTADLPTVKAREREERTKVLISQERIEPCVRATLAEDTSQLDEPEVPGGADLIHVIKKGNERQNLGEHERRLHVPETTTDGKIFLRTALIREAHVPQIFAHASENKTVRMLRREYAWPGMTRDIRQYVKNCHECRRNKVPRDKTPGLLHPLPVPKHVWEQVVVDGKDMPFDQYGYNYVWAFVCKFSRILATVPGKKADTVAPKVGCLPGESRKNESLSSKDA